MAGSRPIYRSEAGKQAVEALYRKALQRWPVPHRELVMPTSQGDTFVIVSGERQARPVVLFHGSGTNSSVWMRDVSEWAQRHRVYAVDLIGEPGFSAPARPPFRSDEYVAWLDEVWNRLGLTQASIVGVSLGGWLGLEYAVKRPERVVSLSLLSPSGVGAQRPLFLLKAGLLLMLRKWGVGQAFKLTAGRTTVPSEVINFVTLVFQHFRPRMDTLPMRTDDELASLEMPVQVILGGKDALLRSDQTRDRLQRHVRDLHMIYLEEEGHLLPRQTTTIAEFLNRAASQTAFRTKHEGPSTKDQATVR